MKTKEENPDITGKHTLLKDYFKQLGSAVIAFSGGVDSTLLIKVAHDILKQKAIAVTADTSSLAAAELEHAKKLASQIGISHIIVNYEETCNEEYTTNTINRCYHCKNMLFSKLNEIAEANNIKHIIEGSNFDDLGDHRPGLVAAKQYNIKSPLIELKFTKNEIRKLSKQLGLETHNKPQKACLSSRIPYGQEITQEKLWRIEAAEEYLKNLGISQLRVRHHEDIARIEVEQNDFITLIKNSDNITKKFKQLGFKFVSLDLEGYKRGKMNQ